MIKMYERLIKNCQSKNLRNRVHIKLENWMVPIQFCELSNALKAQASTDEDAAKWISGLEKFFNKTKKPHPEPFVKKIIDRYTVRFTSKDKSKKSQNKTLLICFTGAFGRMMMPLAVFLQYLNADSTDVIYFKYPHRIKSYRYGMPGYDQSFEEMLDRLGSLPLGKYKRVVGMGSSGGALPVLSLALKYEFDAVMVVGASEIDDHRWCEAIENGVPEMIRRLKKNAEKMPSIYLVYGADAQKDKVAAKRLKMLLPEAKVIKISRMFKKVRHTCLTPLIKSGNFSKLLARTIFRG